MKRNKKENRLQRMMALLLSAALIVCAGINPVHVLADESVSENTAEVTEERASQEVPEETYEEEETPTETAPEDPEEQDGESGQEEEEEEETAGEMDVHPGATAEPEEMAAVFVTESETSTISGIGWILEADGKLTIQSNAGMENWMEDGRENYVEKVISAEVRSGVTSIGSYAFSGCSSLTDITIPTGVTSIGSYAFSECSSLTSITLPDGVTSIGRYAFQDCSSLTDITLWGGMTSIGASAFRDCSSLSKVIMRGSTPPALEDENVFYFCKFVTDNEKGILVPLGTDEAYKEAWADWADYIMGTTESAYDYIAFGEDWTIDADGQLTIHSDVGMEDWWAVGRRAHWKKIAGAEIRFGVTSIPGNSKTGGFSSCENLTSISLPSSVTSIGERAFSGCSSLVDITLPDSVTSIGERAFSGCSSLVDITLPDSVTSIGESAFLKCSSLVDITLSDSLTSIGDEAFWYCSSLTDIVFPSSVTSIGRGAFEGCSSLADIKFSDSVTYISNSCFEDCKSLTSIALPDHVTGIGSDAFAGCTNLKSIMLPDGLTRIDDQAFINCSSLTDITFPDSLTKIGGQAFSYCGLRKVTIPKNVTEMGSILGGTFDYCRSLKSIVIQPGATSVCGGACMDCSSLTDITIPDSVTSIGNCAFSCCSALSTITLPDGVTSIGEQAFFCCSALSTITLPDGVTSIGDEAFWNCSALSAITIPDGVTSIGDGAFSGCSALSTITLPDGVTSIGDGAFSGCSALSTIALPDGVTSIGDQAFSCCALSTIALPDGVTSIGDQAFYGCSALSTITLPDGVTSIGEYAFNYCQSLTSIDIPSGVTSIGACAFIDCQSLESVTMQGSIPPTLGAADEDAGETYVFSRCKFVEDSEKGIKVPWGTEEAYKAAWTDWADYITANNIPTTDSEKVFAAKQAVEAALPAIPVSNDTTQESLETAVKDAIKSALTEVGVSSDDITIAVENFTRTDAAIKAAGSISASIKIASGTESASVPVSKTIDKLPATPANKVASAKTAVENAVKKAIDQTMAGTAVTNDNAEETVAKIRETIPAAVEEALAEAGVSADEIAAGEAVVEIRPATADSEGSINITITLTSGEDAGQSASAAVQVPIAKPGGEDDPDKDVETAQKMVEDALKELTVTNDTTPEDILAALKEKLGDRVTAVGIEKFEKVDATEAAAGNIILGVKVIMNGKTMVISTTVPIPIVRIDKKTGLYIRFTDYYDMDGSTPRYKYTGQAVKPAVEVYNNGTRLVPDRDYTVSYKNNTKVGTAAALLVKGKGNFSGTSSVINFVIGNADIDNDTDHPKEMTVVVNTKVAPIIMNGMKKLTTKDYQLEGDGLVNGKYAVATGEGNPNIMTVKGIGSYAGSSFEIKVRVIERSAAKRLSVVVDRNFKPVYNGSVLNLSGLFQKTQDGEGAITVKDAKEKTKILREGTDFTVLCTSSCLNAGTVNFTVTGMGEYTGSVNKSFKISPIKIADSSKFSVAFDENKAYEYKASGTTVDNLVVKYLGETDGAEDDRILIQGVDYKVTYSNNKKVSGTKDAGFKVIFLGNYKGSSAVAGNFKVVAAKLSAVNTAVIIPDKVYTRANRAYKSTPIVTVDGAAIKASNYTVSYAWATGSESGDDTKYVSDNKVKITMAAGDTWAKVRVTVTPKQTGSYALAEGAALTGEYYVRKADGAADLSRAKVIFFDKAGTQRKALEYNGNPFYTPVGNNAEAENVLEDPNAVYVKVTVGGTVVDPGLYDVIWTDATEKGRATVVIRGKGIATEKGLAVGSRNQSINIKAMTLNGRILESFMGR